MARGKKKAKNLKVTSELSLEQNVAPLNLPNDCLVSNRTNLLKGWITFLRNSSLSWAKLYISLFLHPKLWPWLYLTCRGYHMRCLAQGSLGLHKSVGPAQLVIFFLLTLRNASFWMMSCMHTHLWGLIDLTVFLIFKESHQESFLITHLLCRLHVPGWFLSQIVQL